MTMLSVLILLGASLAEAPRVWNCVNEIEIWCSDQRCAATPPGQFTPLGITADPKGGFSVCAYTGCWESSARPRRFGGRALWTGDNLPFSTARAREMSADVTLLIVERDGVGFIRAGNLATPLRCSLDPAVED
jgi:hypothetical protein